MSVALIHPIPALQVPEPDLEAVPEFFRCDTLKMEVRDKETIRNENSSCRLVMPEDDQDFYNIPVEVLICLELNTNVRRQKKND